MHFKVPEDEWPEEQRGKTIALDDSEGDIAEHRE
jgi:hypothetical protein